MNYDELKEKIAESIDEFLKINLDGRSFDDLFIDNMAANVIYRCEDVLRVPDSWISIVERVPSRQEYFTFKNGEVLCYKRLNIAFQTDTVEYDIGYYDGYKWFNERGHRINNVIAWKPFIPYNQELTGK